MPPEVTEIPRAFDHQTATRPRWTLTPPPPGLAPDPRHAPTARPPGLIAAPCTRVPCLPAVESLGVALLGLILVVAPLLSWYELSGSGIESSVSGWSHDQTHLWILGSVPDGAPISVLGSIVFGISVLTARCVHSRSALAHDGRRLGALLALTGVAGAGWTLWSWARLGPQLEPGTGLLITTVTTTGLAVVGALAFAGAAMGTRHVPARMTTWIPEVSPR